jgi:adenosylhomocysteinase
MTGDGSLRARYVNDGVTNSKSDNLYDCRESLVDGIKRHRPDACRQARRGLWRGQCEQGLGGNSQKPGGASDGHRDRSYLPLQAAMEGYQVTTMDEAASQGDVFVTATGNIDVITIHQMRQMKDRAIVCNIGHFDSEIQIDALRNYPWDEVKPQVDEVVFPDGKRLTVLAKCRLVNLGCATGHPSFAMSASFTNQVPARIELFTNRANTRTRSTSFPSTSTRRSPPSISTASASS